MSTWILRSAALGLLAASFAACGGPEGPETETGADAALPTDAASATPDASSGPIDPPPPGPAPTDPRDMAAVFFSGHSLINVNTPTFFAQLAESEGRGVSFQLQMGLGSPMSVRLACPRSGQQADGGEITFDVQEELRRPGVYDTLIVTERHDIVDAMLGERSTAMARRFRDAFHAGNPAGQPFLFESWYTIDRADPEAFRARAARELVAWQCIASKVNETRGESPAMIVIPAGQMIAEVTGDIVAGRVPGMTDLGQLFLDDVHLTPEGNYLVALVHYGVAFRRTPVGLTHGGLRPLADPPPSISAELATYLQAVASRYVDRTFADASESQRSDAECIELLNGVCEAQYGAGHWACGDMPSRFRDVDEIVDKSLCDFSPARASPRAPH